MIEVAKPEPVAASSVSLAQRAAASIAGR